MTCSYSKDFSTSAYTDVENAFIYEYLPVSSGEAVKVYLYGLFLCQNPAFDQPLSEIAKALKLSEEKVKDCFYFWEEFGLLSIISLEPFTVQYLPVRSSYGSKPRKIKAEKYTEFTKSLQLLIPSRMISTGEYTDYFNIMEDYGIKPEAMLMIIKYCIDRKGSDIGHRYISKVAKDFGNRGIVTIDKVEKELSSYVMRTAEIDRILKAMSLKRQPEIEDSTLLKKWTKELNFEPDNIVFAASTLKKGSMEKLDAFLLELFGLKRFTQEEIADYVKQKQSVYDLAIKINKALSIYVEVIETVIDGYTLRWLSYGFEEQALLLIATHCFKTGKNTLQDMNEMVEHLHARGFIDLSSVGDYFENEKKADEFIKKLLLTAGVNRRPTPWDRENVSTWKNWNFSEDMIIEAAKIASGKSSPIAYINGVLSNWKNNGIFSAESIENDLATPIDNSQETYNREYERRRSIAMARAQKNHDIAMDIQGFAEIYGNINGMEKDLAFAELSNNKDLLKDLERKQAELYAKANALLGTKGLSFDDLSPRYACEKCNDTGYVGTHRCDCFDKKVK